jgi:hypothetical protein
MDQDEISEVRKIALYLRILLGLISAGDPGALAACYIVVLWGDLLIRLLMRVRQAPTKREIEVCARAATETLMALR